MPAGVSLATELGRSMRQPALQSVRRPQGAAEAAPGPRKRANPLFRLSARVENEQVRAIDAEARLRGARVFRGGHAHGRGVQVMLRARKHSRARKHVDYVRGLMIDEGAGPLPPPHQLGVHTLKPRSTTGNVNMSRKP